MLPFVGSDYAISFSIQLLIFLVLAYSWNWIGGYAGYTHFGQVGFFGIGAYVGSLLNFHYGLPWYLAHSSPPLPAPWWRCRSAAPCCG